MIKQQGKKLNCVLWAVGGLILLGAVILAMVLIQTSKRSAETADYHAETRTYSPVLVDFEPLTTTEEEYSSMYNTCTEYMTVNRLPGDGYEANIVIEVSEDTYFDSDPTAPEMTETATVEYQEYDRVYFERLLLLRYVNELGEIQVIGAGMDQRADKIIVLTQDEFDFEQFNFTHWWDWAVSTQSESEESEAVSQDAYISCIQQCIMQMLTGEEDRQRIWSHFTEEGETAVRRIGQVLGINSDSTIVVQLGAVGKSDLNQETMDRLYLRYEITDEGESSYLNILVKMNRDTVIFDVDII